MKVVAKKIIRADLGVTKGMEYEVLVSMKSTTGGLWAEIVNDLGLVTLIRVGGYCALAEWEEV